MSDTAGRGRLKRPPKKATLTFERHTTDEQGEAGGCAGMQAERRVASDSCRCFADELWLRSSYLARTLGSRLDVEVRLGNRLSTGSSEAAVWRTNFNVGYAISSFRPHVSLHAT